MKRIVAIIDYGLGNIKSAEQSIKQAAYESNLEVETSITKNLNEIASSTHIILPGQGAFESCINGLKNIDGMIEELSKSALVEKKPFLGICVGMQLLATKSFENGEHFGLDWIPGLIKKIPTSNLKLPHMGWNEIIVKESKNKLLKNIKNKDYYFVHSYYFSCKNRKNEIATSNYGIDFASIICKENIYGAQFHPEKSSKQGLDIIKNFIKL